LSTEFRIKSGKLVPLGFQVFVQFSCVSKYRREPSIKRHDLRGNAVKLERLLPIGSRVAAG